MNWGQPIYILNTVFSFNLLQRYPTLMSVKPLLLIVTPYILMEFCNLQSASTLQICLVQTNKRDIVLLSLFCFNQEEVRFRYVLFMEVTVATYGYWALETWIVWIEIWCKCKIHMGFWGLGTKENENIFYSFIDYTLKWQCFKYFQLNKIHYYKFYLFLFTS